MTKPKPQPPERPNIKPLLQELIDKDVNLEHAAEILWQWRIWEDAKDEERYGKARNASPDAQGHLHKVSEMHRLQLANYMAVADISQELIDSIIKPHNRSRPSGVK